MALVTISDILEETGAEYADYGFSDQSSFETWIQKKLEWVDEKIEEMTGPYYDDGLKDLNYAEIYWTFSEMLRRKQSTLGSAVEGGFAIASLRIDSSASATKNVKDIADDYFRKAKTLLGPYVSISVDQFLVVEGL